MKPHEEAVFRFGDFVLVPSERLLLRAGKAISLTGKAFDLLVALVESAGHLRAKDDLMACVWPGVVVEEVNLSVNISALRKTLGEAPDGVPWIETVSRKGYRFRASVEIGDVSTLDLAGLPGGSAPARQGVPPMPGEVVPPTISRRVALAGLAGVAAAAGAGMWWLARHREPYASVAVLPFGADAPANQYLADGLAESLLQRLASVPGLRVVPRASAFSVRDADPIEAGRKLGAASVITGRVAQSAQYVKVDLDLRDVARVRDGWSASFEGAPAEVAQVAARAASEASAALGWPLPSQQRAAIERPATQNVEAFQAYLQGKYLWNQRSEASLLRAATQFARAVELDPAFAAAHAGRADVHAALGYLGHAPPVATFPIARPFALRALDLDPTLADARAALGYVKLYFDWDWKGAEEELRRAVALASDRPNAHQWLSVLLLAAGRADEALRELQTAQRLDPLSLAINTDLGFHHYYAGRYDAAIAQLLSVLGMKEDFVLAHLWLARSYIEVGRLDDAFRQLERLDALREWPVLAAARGYAFGVAGRTAQAHAVLAEMKALSQRRFVTAYGMGLVHAGLGEVNEAIAWLEKAFEERSHWLVWLRLDPRWKRIRADPRFIALIARMNYPA